MASRNVILFRQIQAGQLDLQIVADHRLPDGSIIRGGHRLSRPLTRLGTARRVIRRLRRRFPEAYARYGGEL